MLIIQSTYKKIKVCNNYTCWLMKMPCKHSIILRHMANYNIQNSSFIKVYKSGRYRVDAPGVKNSCNSKFCPVTVRLLLSKVPCWKTLVCCFALPVNGRVALQNYAYGLTSPLVLRRCFDNSVLSITRKLKSNCNIFIQKNWQTNVLMWGHWYPWTDFSLACFPACMLFLRSTSSATPANLLMASMVTGHIPYIHIAKVGCWSSKSQVTTEYSFT